MNAMTLRRKGFTLIEILIVVVIIAVLASLILPRLTGQTENGYLAGAQRTLGMLRNGQRLAFSTTGSYQALTAAETTANMPVLGLQGISDAAFSYACDSAGKCIAVRLGAGTHAGDSLGLTVDGAYNCSGYQTGGGKTGCRP